MLLPTSTLEKQTKKEKRIEGEREKLKRSKERRSTRAMKKTEEVNKGKVVVSLCRCMRLRYVVREGGKEGDDPNPLSGRSFPICSVPSFCVPEHAPVIYFFFF